MFHLQIITFPGLSLPRICTLPIYFSLVEKRQFRLISTKIYKTKMDSQLAAHFHNLGSMLPYRRGSQPSHKKDHNHERKGSEEHAGDSDIVGESRVGQRGGCGDERLCGYSDLRECGGHCLRGWDVRCIGGAARCTRSSGRFRDDRRTCGFERDCRA